MGEELDTGKIDNDQVLCRVGRERQAWRHDSLGVVLENVEARSSSLSRLTELRRGSLCIDKVAVAGHGSVALGVTNVPDSGPTGPTAPTPTVSTLNPTLSSSHCPRVDSASHIVRASTLPLTLSARRLCF